MTSTEDIVLAGRVQLPVALNFTVTGLSSFVETPPDAEITDANVAFEFRATCIFDCIVESSPGRTVNLVVELTAIYIISYTFRSAKAYDP
jgi:hypothetical protein